MIDDIRNDEVLKIKVIRGYKGQEFREWKGER